MSYGTWEDPPYFETENLIKLALANMQRRYDELPVDEIQNVIYHLEYALLWMRTRTEPRESINLEEKFKENPKFLNEKGE
jgi:hypothetical protein